MHLIDWAVVVVYLVWIVWDGLRRSKATTEVEGYFLANRSLPWWAVGLSVMATQLSAITLVGTTGRGYAEGLSVVQLYFGLPIAMVILSIVLGWNLTLTILGIGLPTVLYTMVGGVQAVTWTDVKQMGVIIVGVGAAVVVLLLSLPETVSVGEALHIAGATGRMQAIDFQWDLSKTYTFWSGMIGGLFLMLSYFGCDQSQVQRYLTAKSVDEGRQSLLMSAYFKIPLQFLIPMIGVLMFVFYLFHQPPLLFNHQHDAQVRASVWGGEYQGLEQEFAGALDVRRAAAESLAASRTAGGDEAIGAAEEAFRSSDAQVAGLRSKATTLVREVTGDQAFGDVNYVFPTFVTDHMPIGLVGLIIAAIFAAAMSSIAAELNSLSTATVIDFYRRLWRTSESDAHYLRVSKLVTLFWGVVACTVAIFAANLGPLIDVVNRFGSFFYGSLLGVFVLAIGVKRATSRGAFWGLLAGMAVVALVANYSTMAFLWHNVVGTVTVVVVGLLVSLTEKPRS